MIFRHPERLDRQRFHQDLDEGADIGVNRPAQSLIGLLVVLAFISLLAVGSLASQGSSLAPLLAIAAGFAALLLLSCLRPR
jgi:hypothetical protein